MKHFRAVAFFAAMLAMALCVNIACPLSANAQGSGISQRMRARLPAIDSLKLRGAIGENNQGYLSIRTSLDANERKVVDGENADRAVVYETIGGRTGVDANAVGRARAEQIARKSAPGVWIQDSSGRWYKK